MKTSLLILLLCLGIINMLRIVVFMIASDVHEVVAYRRKKRDVTTGPRQPWISVIIPAYNAAKYLPSAIESVIAQTFDDWRMVLNDDGSINETPEIMRRFVE